jgi:hypothetical protein
VLPILEGAAEALLGGSEAAAAEAGVAGAESEAEAAGLAGRAAMAEDPAEALMQKMLKGAQDAALQHAKHTMVKSLSGENPCRDDETPEQCAKRRRDEAVHAVIHSGLNAIIEPEE